jgi:23S rRNA (cytosine1962-C5)-methyltransferase
MSWSQYIWIVQKGHDRRVRAGHPWVFSNELTKSPKGHPVGHPVELRDDRGNFIAAGYGNPNSLISFRALSFEPVSLEPHEFLMNKVIGAWKKRLRLGLTNSFRLAFSENDYLSGLMVDYYVVEQNGQTGQVFSIQISTAGMDYLLKDVPGFFKSLTENALGENLTTIPWSHTSIVLKNDIQIRKLEGLEVEDAKVIHQSEHFKLDDIDILITTPIDQNSLKMSTDLIDGQKTGFFLDQTRNIEIVLSQLNKIFKSSYAPKKLKILDLCCYVGHWSAQLAHFCKLHEVEVEITAVDISPKALASASKNIARLTKNFKTVELDVIDKLDTMTEKFDVVICDPPALIKNKKSIPTGQHAYLKLNTNAMNLLAPQGLYVSCSCSGLFEKTDFLSTLRKSQTRSKKTLQILAEGGHAADHPHLASFPEGFYLKMLLLS